MHLQALPVLVMCHHRFNVEFKSIAQSVMHSCAGNEYIYKEIALSPSFGCQYWCVHSQLHQVRRDPTMVELLLPHPRAEVGILCKPFDCQLGSAAICCLLQVAMICNRPSQRELDGYAPLRFVMVVTASPDAARLTDEQRQAVHAVLNNRDAAHKAVIGANLAQACRFLEAMKMELSTAQAKGGGVI